MAKGRKPLPDEKIKQIMVMAKEKTPSEQIAKELGLSLPTIRSYVRRYGNWQTPELTPEEEQEIAMLKNGSKYRSPESTDNEEIRREKPMPMPKPKALPDEEEEEPLTQKGYQKFLTTGSEFLGAELLAMLKTHMAAAKSLLESKLKYEKSLIDMDISWDDFISFSLKLGFSILEEEFIKEKEREIEERGLTLEIEERLHEEDIKDIEGRD